MKKKTKLFIIISTLFMGSFLFIPFVSANQVGIYAQLYAQELRQTLGPELAQELNIERVEEDVVIDSEFVNNGGVVSALKNKISLSFPAHFFNNPQEIKIKKVTNNLNLPWRLQKISPVFEYNLEQDFVGDYQVKIKYSEKNNWQKEIFYYDLLQNAWKPLESSDDPENMVVSAKIFLPRARLAIFAHPNVMTVGQASWYAYRHGDFAASPDFPKGSIIKVTNLENNKSIKVTINDWGPERDKFPNRAIDLDKVAFAKIANVHAGIINVKLEPIYIAPDNAGRVLGVKEVGMANEPAISATSAVILDGETGQVLFDKDGDKVLPLASLTKLLSIYTYLQTKPNLFSKIEYKYEDEKITYQYAKPWEIARLRLKPGDQVLAVDLIYSALVGSANNAVETLVRSSGLSRIQFMQKMNQIARSFGARQSRFVEPTGLSPENVTTAKNYAIIIKEVLKNKTIAQASTTKRYNFKTINTAQEHYLKNTDKLLNLHPEIVGSKTGYLNEAKYCLATKIKKGNRSFLLVLLGEDNREKSFSEMSDLITYANHNL